MALREKENISPLMNIAQEDDSNIFKLLKNLWLNNLQFIILKCYRFCLCITFLFILILLYTQILNIVYLMVSYGKKKKKQFKSQPSPWLLKFSLFYNPPYYSNPSPPTISFWYFFQISPTIPHPLSIRDLSVHTLSAICNITDESNKLN